MIVEQSPGENSPFKVCPSCRHVWATRGDFLSDPAVSVVGYQAHFVSLELGLFYFNHDVPECGTTLSLPAQAFLDMYAGPLFTERQTSGPNCPGHCLHDDDLEPCPRRCECAYVRTVLRQVREWPKTPG
mgnify:CR=1 FL=1